MNTTTAVSNVFSLERSILMHYAAGISEYFAQLTKTYRDLGVVIPTMDNDPGMFRNLINDVNIYG